MHLLSAAVGEPIQIGDGLVVIREPSFVGAKRGVMIYAASADSSWPMLEVQHLVVEHIFNQKLRHLRNVQRPADDYCIVYVIVVPEDTFRAPLAPTERRLWKLIVEIAAIEGCEQMIAIVETACRTREF